MKVKISPYKVGCHKCRKMVDFYIETTRRLLCFKCWNNEKRLEKKNKSFKKRPKKFFKLKKNNDKSIYAINGITSVICSGTF